MKYIKKFNESLEYSKEDILKTARSKYSEYSKYEDGDQNFWEIDLKNNKVTFYKYNNRVEWSEPEFSISIDELMKFNEKYSKDEEGCWECPYCDNTFDDDKEGYRDLTEHIKNKH